MKTTPSEAPRLSQTYYCLQFNPTFLQPDLWPPKSLGASRRPEACIQEPSFAKKKYRLASIPDAATVLRNLMKRVWLTSISRLLLVALLFTPPSYAIAQSATMKAEPSHQPGRRQNTKPATVTERPRPSSSDALPTKPSPEASHDLFQLLKTAGGKKNETK